MNCVKKFNIGIILLAALIFVAPSFGGQIVNLPLSADLVDTKGNLTSGSLSRVSAATYVNASTSLLTTAWGDRDQLIDTGDQNDDTNWPLTIAVTANTTYTLSTDTNGATVTVAEDTATLSATGSATYGNHFNFTCTAAGNITLSVSGSSTPRAMLEELPSGNTISAELMPNQVDRDFSGASAWTNNNINSYDETTDLTITADGSDQYCNIATASAPMTQNEWYLLQFDVANLVSGWTISDNDAGFTIGTIDADAGGDGTYQFHFKYTDATGGGITITSNDADSSGDFDNFSLKNTPELALLEPSTYVNSATVPAKARFESAGLLIEGEGTNLLEYEDFSQWASAGLQSLTLDATGPDGEISAYSFLEATNNGHHRLDWQFLGGNSDLVIQDNTSYTASVFLGPSLGRTEAAINFRNKGGVWAEVWFNLTGDGSVGTNGVDAAGIERVGDFYRIWATEGSSTGSTAFWILFNIGSGSETKTYAGDVTKGMVYFGPQLEATPYPTSYIPTDGTQVTRTTEAGSASTGVTWTISSDIQTALANNGTLIVDFTPGFASADGSGTGTSIITFEPSATGFIYYDFTNTDLEITDSTNTVTVDETLAAQAYTLVGRWHKANDDLNLSKKESGSWTHGTAGAFDDSIPHTGNKLYLNYGNEYPAHYKNIYFYDDYLTDAQVEGEIWSFGAGIMVGF